ncbi:MAG TPA: prepilin-type N-terminal cleavage/methylation domain-containing protein [Candidatus Eremiobacteraceae bacterium]|nr:prepilin-type N-terminal cleavage/methylation domain-containing protein [Candidatus Eremiobacteraceae bacterium]
MRIRFINGGGRHTRSRALAGALAILSFVVVGGMGNEAQAASSQSYVPAVLASMHDFRGRIDYVAKRDDNSAVVDGTLIVDDQGWILDERTRSFELHANPKSASVRSSAGDSVTVDDLFGSDALSNAWAPLLGESAASTLVKADNPGLWDSGDLRVFLDPTGSQVIGFRETRDNVAYTLDEWWAVGPLVVPHRILRLRGGEPSVSYTVSDYVIQPTVVGQGRGATPAAGLSLTERSVGFVTLDDVPIFDVTWAQRAAAIAFALLVLALGIVAWSRRDALIGALCVRMARDPRGWRTAGVSVFVEPDGTMTVDGSRYRVGPHFFNRAALVQRSVLFVRVSSPAVPHVVILPRKFTRIELGLAVRGSRKRVAGFTLIETMVATALFAGVVLLAVYPAIAAVARADAMASKRAEAVVLASNALADEEAASAYDTNGSFGKTTTTVDGLTTIVTVSPGTIRDESDLDVVVTDGNGDVLAHVVSWLGVAVGAPPSSSGGPPQQ